MLMQQSERAMTPRMSAFKRQRVWLEIARDVLPSIPMDKEWTATDLHVLVRQHTPSMPEREPALYEMLGKLRLEGRVRRHRRTRGKTWVYTRWDGSLPVPPPVSEDKADSYHEAERLVADHIGVPRERWETPQHDAMTDALLAAWHFAWKHQGRDSYGTVMPEPQLEWPDKISLKIAMLFHARSPRVREEIAGTRRLA